MNRPSSVALAERPVGETTAVVALDTNGSSAAGADAPRRGIAVGGIIRTGLKLFVVLCVALAAFLFLGTALVHNREQVVLEREFRASAANLALPPQFEPVAAGRTTADLRPIPLGSAIARLDAPAAGIHEVVSEGSSSGITRQGPGHVRASPLPGQYGNSVILGRRTTYGGPFRHLDRLRAGDTIAMTTGFGVVRYRVMSAGTAPPDDAAVFGTLVDAKRRSRNTLTLVTSDPAVIASRRYVVQAQLVGRAEGFSPAPFKVGADELGLAGEPGAWLVLVLWLQLLLLASLATVWLFRRWDRWCAWIVSTPVLLAAMWLVFEQFTRVLPATL